MADALANASIAMCIISRRSRQRNQDDAPSSLEARYERITGKIEVLGSKVAAKAKKLFRRKKRDDVSTAEHVRLEAEVQDLRSERARMEVQLGEQKRQARELLEEERASSQELAQKNFDLEAQVATTRQESKILEVKLEQIGEKLNEMTHETLRWKYRHSLMKIESNCAFEQYETSEKALEIAGIARDKVAHENVMKFEQAKKEMAIALQDAKKDRDIDMSNKDNVILEVEQKLHAALARSTQLRKDLKKAQEELTKQKNIVSTMSKAQKDIQQPLKEAREQVAELEKRNSGLSIDMTMMEQPLAAERKKNESLAEENMMLHGEVERLRSEVQIVPYINDENNDSPETSQDDEILEIQYDVGEVQDTALVLYQEQAIDSIPRASVNAFDDLLASLQPAVHISSTALVPFIQNDTQNSSSDDLMESLSPQDEMENTSTENPVFEQRTNDNDNDDESLTSSNAPRDNASTSKCEEINNAQQAYSTLPPSEIYPLTESDNENESQEGSVEIEEEEEEADSDSDADDVVIITEPARKRLIPKSRRSMANG